MTKVGVELLGPNVDFAELKTYMTRVETFGFDSVWMADNIAWKDPETGVYIPIYEAWTTLAALAALSSRVQLGSMVTPCGRRHPALLAKMVSTVDVISNGRVVLGLGTGDVESHFELWGMALPPVRERIALLREEIEIIRRLWTEEAVTYESDRYTLYRAPNNPQPVQVPHPPIMLGLVLGKTLMPKLVAEHADIVNIYIRSDVAAKQHLDNIERYCHEIGRPFAEIEKARCLFVSVSEDGAGLPTYEQDLSATLEEEALKVKTSDDFYRTYKEVTQRYVIGTPEQVARELNKIADLGFDHIVIIGLDPVSLDLIGKKVLPIVQAH